MLTISSPNIISLHKSDGYYEDFLEDFSKFKHGSKKQARIFGEKAAEICDFKAYTKLVFYSAPFKHIPTASNAFMEYLFHFCSKQFTEKHISVRIDKINRLYSYHEDYGMMDKDERSRAISSDLFQIDSSNLSKDDILVFIDDVKISGNHQSIILKMLERENISNETLFIYISVYTGQNCRIENSLNHQRVNKLDDIDYIIKNEGFIFNTRVVKYILKSDMVEFLNFIQQQSDCFKEKLFNLSILNDYHCNSLYKSNFTLLRNMIS